MEETKLGIKETKEALIAVNEIAVLLAERLKDGAGIDDAMAVWSKLNSDADFKAKLEAGMDKIKDVPAEIKDLDLSEGLELAMEQIKYVPKLVAALKKEEPVA